MQTVRVESRSDAEFLRGQIVAVSEEITGALRTLFTKFADPIVVPSKLTKATGINRNSASKITMALEKREPLASMYTLPGPEALRKLVRGAKRAGIHARDLERFEKALGEYENLVTVVLDGKPSLDAVLAAWLPDVRERVESANRHLVFRGMAALRGVCVDTACVFGFVTPSATVPERCDVLTGTVNIGFRRLVPGAPIRLMSMKHENPAQRFETIDGREIRNRPTDGMLPEYCSTPMPKMHVVQFDDRSSWSVSDDDFGIHDSLDLVFAEVGIGLGFTNPPAGRRMGQAHVVIHPTREVIVDMFIHNEAWNSLVPECVAYDTAGHGCANFNDHSRDVDRLPLNTRLINLGTGIGSAAVSSIPRYCELLEDLCTRRGMNSREFRGYRFASTYPVYGGQYSMYFTSK
jgi:hypothetical protein